MSTGVVILALLGSMMVGALLAVLVDTFYMRRWHEAAQSDKVQLDEKLRQRAIQLGRTEAEQADLRKKLRAYQRELAEEQAEANRLDDLRVALETKLETAVLDIDALKAEIKQFDDEIDDLRDEKVEFARQLTAAHVELKHLTADLTEAEAQVESLEQLEAENQKLAAKLELVAQERDERKAEVEKLLNKLAAIEKLQANLQEKESKLETAHSQIDNMQSALGRAKSQIKHTGKSQLQLIKGIGPATERKLKTAGIVTIADLAAQTPERLGEILNLTGSARSKLETWVAEAQQLAPTFSEETP